MADSFADPVHFDDPQGHFLREMSAVAKEIEEVTRTPEGCEKFMNDIDVVFGAAICFNLAANRIKARAKD